jgi:hypothetical protein
VEEAMMCSANLKLDEQMSIREKREMVRYCCHHVYQKMLVKLLGG